MSDGRDERWDDALYIGQTEMGHIGPRIDRPIFLIVVLPMGGDAHQSTSWKVKRCIDSGDPNFRANDADLCYDTEYLEGKDGHQCILQVVINLMAYCKHDWVTRVFWSVRMMYVSTQDALTNLGPYMSGCRQQLKECIEKWSKGYLFERGAIPSSSDIPDGDGAINP